MHVVICRAGSDQIERVIRDIAAVTPNGAFWEIMCLCGGGQCVRKDKVDLHYTNDPIDAVYFDEACNPIKWSKALADLTPCPVLDGQPVGCDGDVNAVTTARISKEYSTAQEIKILRRAVQALALATGADPGEEFTRYNAQIEALVEEGRAVKDTHFKKEATKK